MPTVIIGTCDTNLRLSFSYQISVTCFAEEM